MRLQQMPARALVTQRSRPGGPECGLLTALNA